MSAASKCQRKCVPLGSDAHRARSAVRNARATTKIALASVKPRQASAPRRYEYVLTAIRAMMLGRYAADPFRTCGPASLLNATLITANPAAAISALRSLL